MNQQQSVVLAFILCMIIFCPDCYAEEGLQLSLPKISIDKEILKPLSLKPATSSVTLIKKESTTMPFQALRNDAESLVKPMSVEKKKELPKETVSSPSIPGTISYQPKLEINKEKWEETRSQVEKAEQVEEEIGRRQEAERVGEVGDTEEIKKLRERIISEERKRFEEERGRIEEELQRLRDKAKNVKPEEPPDVVVGEVGEVGTVGEVGEVGKGTGTQGVGQGTRTVKFMDVSKNILKGLKLPGFKKKIVPAAGGSKQSAVDSKQGKGTEAVGSKQGGEKSPHLVAQEKPKEIASQSGILYKLLNKLKGPQDENLEKKKELFNIEPDKGITQDFSVAKLTISGNKSIKTNFGSAAYLDKVRRTNKEAPPIASTGFGIDQTLNVKLNGVVQDKITVNVDYNDTNGQERRNVNIDYKDPKAAISDVNFGDVNLSDISDPKATFVSANKQLFGIRVKGKYKKQYDVAMVMSKTKGKSATQVLSKKDRKAVELTHTSYSRYKYYRLIPQVKGKKTITILGVYMDNRNNNDVQRNITATATVTLSKVINGGTGTINDNLTKFERLANQKDYTIDENGILTINRSISEAYCIGIVFTYGTETYPAEYSKDPENPGSVWMIKPRSDFVGGINYDIFECRNIYNLSGLQSGDIGVTIIDKQGKSFFTEGGTSTSYARLFGLDNNADGYIDSAFIDYNRKLLIFPDDTPFNLIDSGSTMTNGFLNATATAMATETLSKYSAIEMYKSIPDRTAISTQPTYNIKLAYKTSGMDAYMLQGWNIVENSEQIFVNEVKMTRGINYMVDYSSGFLTFFTNPPDNANIRAEYEYASFGAEQQKNLVGARMQYKPNDNFHFGSTLIYNGASGSADIPKIGSSPESLQVFGVDSSVNLTALANKALKALKMKKPLPFSISLEGELAASRLDVNTFGYSLIDSMEGVKETMRASTYENNWQIGSLPTGTGSTRIMLKANSEKVEGDKGPFIGPYSKKEEIRWKDKENEEKQEEEVLYLDYAPPAGMGTWCVSVVSPLSRGAGSMDMREYTDMELWIKQSNNAKIFIDLGVVSEDADGTGTTVLSEDKDKNGLLDKGEDIGWEFGTTTIMVGANNRKIDTEDLDGDGQLSTQNHYFTLTLDKATDTTQGMGLNGFSRYRVSLKDAIKSSNETSWELIKHIRIRLEGATDTTGQVCIGDISLIKSRWSMGSVTTTTDASTITVSSLNSQDDPQYQSIKNEPGFDSLYPNKEITREEAMVIKYDILAKTGTTTPAGFVFRKVRQQNYNYYKNLSFWLKNVSGTGTFFIKMGIDENNYIEYAFPLPQDNGWKKVELSLSELKDKMVELIKGTKTTSFNYATATSPFSGHPQVTRILGNPELTNIQWMAMGIQNEGTTTSTKGEIWVNEIHLSGAEPVTGDARRISVNAAYPGWGNIGWSNQAVGSDFQRITDDSPGANNTTSDSVTLSFNRIKILPVTCSYEKKIEQTDPAKINDILRSDFGSKTTIARKIGVNLKDLGSIKLGTGAVSSYLKNKISPLTINANYSDSQIDAKRQDDTSLKNAYTLSGAVNYKYTFPKRLLKIIPTGDSLILSPAYNYNRTFNNEAYPLEKIKNKEETHLSDDGKLGIEFVPLRQKNKDNTPGKVILSGRSDIALSQTRKQLIKVGTESDAAYRVDGRKFRVSIKDVKYDAIPGISPKFETEIHFDESNFRNGEPGKRLKDLVTSNRFVINGGINPKEWIKPVGTTGQKPDWKHKLVNMVTINPGFEVVVNANYSNIDEGVSILDGISRAYKDYYKDRLWKGIEANEGAPTMLFGSGTTRPNSSITRKFNLTSNWSLWKPLTRSSVEYVFSEGKNQVGVGNPSLTNNTTYTMDMSMDMISALQCATSSTVMNMSRILPRYIKYLGSSTTVSTKITKSHAEDMSQLPIKITDNLTVNSNLCSTRLIGRKINSTFNMSWNNTTSNKPNGLKDHSQTISPNLKLKYNESSAKPVGMLGRKLTLSRKLDTECTVGMNFIYKEVDNKLTEHKWDILTRIANSYELQKNTTSSASFEIGYTHNGLEENKDYYNYKWNATVQFKF
ncbi:MAG: hypothetical protein ABH886_03455 [Candidatus Desantisbacteria bacterium]